MIYKIKNNVMSKLIKNIIAILLFLVFLTGGVMTSSSFDISRAISYPIMIGGFIAFASYIWFVWKKPSS